MSPKKCLRQPVGFHLLSSSKDEKGIIRTSDSLSIWKFLRSKQFAHQYVQKLWLLSWVEEVFCLKFLRRSASDHFNCHSSGSIGSFACLYHFPVLIPHQKCYRGFLISGFEWSMRKLRKMWHVGLSGMVKWIIASGILCDYIIPLKLKDKFYTVAARPTLNVGWLRNNIFKKVMWKKMLR